MSTWKSWAILASSVALISAGPAPAHAMENVKVATSFVGLWDTSQPNFCKERGEFEKAGLDVSIISTRGGSETVQAVTAGGMDIGYSPAVNSVAAAYVGGAKIKIVSAEFKGQNDTYFYVPTNSPLKTISDIKGKTVAYPRPGGASEALLLSLKHDTGLDFKMVATGGLSATYTMTMTKQVDVGYSFPPYILDKVVNGEVRVLFSGEAVKSQRDLTQRTIIASSDMVAKRRPVVKKFLEVLNGCINWAYAHPDDAAKMYAKINKIDLAVAKKGMEFYKRDTLALGPLSGFDAMVKQAVETKVLAKPLTAEQKKDLVDIIYDPKK
jgi:NitT/TauT family transport system substrate-binding protein